MFIRNFTVAGSNPENTYSQEKGFGVFEPNMATTSQNTASEQALKSGGWNRREFEETNSFPDREVLIIKTRVPSFGTYSCKVRISSKDNDIENAMLFSGRRNLIDSSVSIKADEIYEKQFYTAVTPYIPGLSAQRCNDKDVFISITGQGLFEANNSSAAVLKSGVSINVEIEEHQVPIIWIAGDSTLTDQNAGIPYFAKYSCGGWAQMLSEYIKDAAVCNLAHSGLTTNCFRDDGHYSIVQEFIKPGDVFILQFGHNDQKRRNLNAFKGYAANIRRYVNEVRAAGAEAIICSPISRIPLSLTEEEAKRLEMPKKYSLLKSYAKAAREVAKELNVSYAELHDKTFDDWVFLGDKSRDFFMTGDITHTNDHGAKLIAGYFMECMRNLDCSPIDGFDNGRSAIFDEGAMDEAVPPKELPGPSVADIELPYVDIPKIRDCVFINEALKYGLLDPCVMHLHPDEEMPRSQFLMTMFKAFRMNAVRPYQKKYADLEVDEWDSGFVQALIDENLIDDITIKKDRDRLYFRPDDALSYGEYASFIIRFMEKDKEKRNISMEDCLRKAHELDIIGDICKDNEIDTELSYEGDDSTPYRVAGCPYISRAKAYRGLARMMDILGNMKDELPADAEIHPAH